MSDVIDRQEAIKALKKLYDAWYVDSDYTEGLTDGIDESIDEIRNMPCAEKQTGFWILWNYPDNRYTKCSVCGEQYDQECLYIGGDEYPKFCPNCGAKMDLHPTTHYGGV